MPNAWEKSAAVTWTCGFLIFAAYVVITRTGLTLAYAVKYWAEQIGGWHGE